MLCIHKKLQVQVHWHRKAASRRRSIQLQAEPPAGMDMHGTENRRKRWRQ